VGKQLNDVLILLSLNLKRQIQNYSQYDVICNKLHAIQTEINGLESLLETVKTKKEKYLDSLISNQFVAKEREKINAKIDKFTILEKQFKGSIMKQPFEYTQKKDQLSSVETLKKERVFFKINSQSLRTKELKKWLLVNVERVDISKDESVLVTFKSVDLSV
jgi:hypothetical protein